MSGKLLLDTNAVLGFLNGQTSMVMLIEQAGVGQLLASVITRMELLSFHGITAEEESLICRFLDALTVVPLNADVEAMAISLRRATRRKMPDAIVAASAVVSGATLVTYDRELAATVFPGLTVHTPSGLI